MTQMWPWLTLALLGAYHGINPGMGWLFAVSLGLQERSRSAVLRAFAPIAIGHFVSIAAVVALVAALRFAVAPEILRYAGAAVLIAFGMYKLLAPMSHPRWVGMRVGAAQLALWSFLMATAHGAGLMVAPVVLKIDSGPAGEHIAEASSVVRLRSASPVAKDAPACHTGASPTASASEVKANDKDPRPEAGTSCHTQLGRLAGNRRAGVLPALAGAGLHTLAMFLAMAGIALLVYDRIGLKILRTSWYNLDLIWSLALIGAGALTLFI